MTITSRALAFASRWFDEATVHRTFEPMIADWQREWVDASSSRRVSVIVSGAAAFVISIIVSSPSLLRTHAPSSVTNRVAVRMTRFIALTSLVLTYPFLSLIPESGWRAMIILVAVVPSSIALVFPFSMIGAVDAIRRYEPLAPHVERALVAKLAIIAVLFMIVFHGFVVPASNQLFREATTPGPAPARGLRELTTYQLISDPALATVYEPYTAGADRAVRIQRELNNRAALTVVPVLLLWLRWRAIGSGRGTWWSPWPAPLFTTLMFATFSAAVFLGFQLERSWRLPAGLGHWLPVAAFAMWGALSNYRRPQAPSPSAPAT